MTMRILLIAYEFPPIISGQSLRWFYLANEFAKQGIEVHVLCPNMPALPPFSEELHDDVIVHRTWAGPYVGVSQSIYLLMSRLKNQKDSPGKVVPVDPSHQSTTLLKIYRWGRQFLDRIIFPDLRSEWVFSASLRLIQLLGSKSYNAIVSSHEPGASLILGLLGKRISQLPFIADLADPVVAPHAPKWRYRFDLAFEAMVLKRADAAVVTTEAASELFMNRHGLQDIREKFSCVTQGFPSRGEKSTHIGHRCSELLKIVYTGNFYEDFRSPAQLAIALKSLEDLTIQVDFYGNHTAYQSLFEGIGKVIFHGAVDHHICLMAQQSCDVLLSLGNRQAFQVPGKIYEYLGAGVPILHIAMSETDEAGLLISNVGAGWAVCNESGHIAGAIRDLHAKWLENGLKGALARREDAIEEYSWNRRAAQYAKIIRRVADISDGIN